MFFLNTREKFLGRMCYPSFSRKTVICSFFPYFSLYSRFANNLAKTSIDFKGCLDLIRKKNLLYSAKLKATFTQRVDIE